MSHTGNCVNIGHYHHETHGTTMYFFRVSYFWMTIVGLLLRLGISLCPTWRERHVAVVVTHDESMNQLERIKG